MSMSISPAAAPMPASCPHDAAGGGAFAADPAALPAGGATAGAAALGGGATPDIATALTQVTQALAALTEVLARSAGAGAPAAGAPVAAGAADPVAGGGGMPAEQDPLTGLETRLDAAITATPDKQAQLEQLRPMIAEMRTARDQSGSSSPADGATLRSKILRITASPEHTAKLDQIDADISKFRQGAEATGAFNPGEGLSLELRLRAVEQDLQGYDPAAFDAALKGADALAAEQGPVDPARMQGLMEQHDAAFGGTTTPDALI